MAFYDKIALTATFLISKCFMVAILCFPISDIPLVRKYCLSMFISVWNYILTINPWQRAITHYLFAVAMNPSFVWKEMHLKDGYQVNSVNKFNCAEWGNLSFKCCYKFPKIALLIVFWTSVAHFYFHPTSSRGKNQLHNLIYAIVQESFKKL